MKLNPSLKRYLLFTLHTPSIILNKYFVSPKQAIKIKNIIKQSPVGEEVSLSESFFFGTSFRISSQERFDILKATLKESLRGFTSPVNPIKLKVSDASDSEYALKNQEIFVDYKGLNLEYTNKKERLNSAYQNMLSTSDESFFGMVFDDFPIIGMSPEFIKACCKLLKNFEGLVDLIYMEGVTHDTIDTKTKTVYYKHADRTILKHRNDILGVVSYNNYRFAIVKNFCYGFFFNRIIARTRQYAEKLLWYMENVDYNSPHKIELAGSLRIGPVYNYIAIPLEVINMDLDYSHTDTSIRKPAQKAEELYKAMTDNYSIQALDKINI